MDPHIVADGEAGVGKSREPDIQKPGALKAVGGRQGIPPVQVILMDAREVEGGPLARPGGLDRRLMDLDPPDPGHLVTGVNLDLLTGGDLALDHGAGDYGAKTAQGKDPVHGQAEGDMILVGADE